MDLLEDFKARGLFHQATDEAALREALSKGVVTGYIGFDPTAASLHVGSLLQIILLVRLQRAGHRPIAVVGGGTGLIGDPSGKQAERTLLTREALDVNLQGIRKQLGRYLDFEAPTNAALMIDNADWLCGLGLIDFLRDVGKHFSVNAMVQRDAVKKRLEERDQGISYTEFSYMLLQAYDFVALYDRHGCTLQLGGSDQWGNIVSGIDLIGRMRGASAHGLTVPLITSSDGTKFGKTEKGAVWLDPALTSPYEFFQFWLNTADADVERYLHFFSFLAGDEVAAVMKEHDLDASKRVAQRRLAKEVTTFVHGEGEFQKAERATRVFFGGDDWRTLDERDLDAAFSDAPSTDLDPALLGTPDAALTTLLVKAGLYPSKGQARTGIEQSGVSVNNAVEKSPQRVISRDDLLPGGYVVLRKGKKHYHVLRAR
ncbi:MAG: tyrosine--tRNA ligase [Polyangiales bacterium]